MELDNLKNDWASLSKQADTAHFLTPQIIDQMTQKKYYSKMNKIKYPEWAGSMVCILSAAYIGFHFPLLDTLFLQMAGITGILLLITMPAISLININRFNLLQDVNKPYVEILRIFAIQKLRFQKIHRLNTVLSCLLLVTIILLLPKLLGGKDLSHNKYFWILSFPCGYLYLLFVSAWVKKSYRNILQQAEELLREVGA